MIILECDNRILTASAKYTYLVTNYDANIGSLVALNVTDSAYAAGTFLLLGNFGAEDAEIVQIQTVDNDGGSVSLVSPTIFAHPESTRATILPYDQIRFFHTTDDTFAPSNPLTGYVDLQPSDWFTTYSDSLNSTGYGWYCFYNSETTIL